MWRRKFWSRRRISASFRAFGSFLIRLSMRNARLRAPIALAHTSRKGPLPRTYFAPRTAPSASRVTRPFPPSPRHDRRVIVQDGVRRRPAHEREDPRAAAPVDRLGAARPRGGALPVLPGRWREAPVLLAVAAGAGPLR